MNITGLIRMLYAFGAILAVIGAIRINYKYNMGKGEMDNEIMVWAGGILFLMVGTTIVQMAM